jgi:uncharacterized protein (TIRG00374 family)
VTQWTPSGEASGHRELAGPYYCLISTESQPRKKKSVLRRVIPVVVMGLGLYIVLPALTRVVSAWPRLATLGPVWLLVMLVAELASFTCQMALLRLVLRTRGWFSVITAGLAGNAVTNTLPGGDVIGAGVQFQMLATAGIDPDQAAGGLAASSVIGIAGLFMLPIFALPVILAGVPVSAGLEHAAMLGIGGFVLILAFGTVVLTTDRTLEQLGRFVQWSVNTLTRKRAKMANLSSRLVAQRNLVRTDLGQNWWKAVLLIGGRIGLDYGALLAALRATGAKPNPSLVLLAYAATAVIALVPITPGGIGIVEASLSGLLVLAGVPGASAIVATLAFRLVTYWLPTIGGGVSYILFRRRYGPVQSSASRPLP